MRPEGAKGFSAGPAPTPIAAAQASWSPAACWRTWVTVHALHGVGASRLSSVIWAAASRSRSRESVMTVQVFSVMTLSSPC